MKSARILITAALLLFVAAGLLYVIVGKGRAEGAAGGPEVAATISPAPVEAAVEEVESGPEARHQVVAYYFHGAKRCRTCRRIEAWTEETMKTAFREEMERGALEWRVLNMEEPANEHYVKDYELGLSSIILSDIWDGKQKEWKNLSRIWHLTGNKEEFQAYVREETEGLFAGERG